MGECGLNLFSVLSGYGGLIKFLYYHPREAIGIICILIIAAVIYTLLITSQKNKKLTELSTRPYLIINYDISSILSSEPPIIVIKNSGRTGAMITSLECTEIDKLSYFGADTEILRKQFDSVGNTSIAPEQSIHLNTCKRPTMDESLELAITYSSGKREYMDSFNLHIGDEAPHYISSIVINDSDIVQKIWNSLQRFIDFIFGK